MSEEKERIIQTRTKKLRQGTVMQVRTNRLHRRIIQRLG
ncbi:hypothetical protein GcC1_152021 [Golovinomyces cichoracearum]|uniref:Uncharacterized protein n=1 Tax=Golovinomyces cichoracearum TaxID=62708 RepID=A0A420HWT3_9PEZI|nr:hypothetical protein GcC1_152021 [Golovinomyces cichoracearum]